MDFIIRQGSTGSPDIGSVDTNPTTISSVLSDEPPTIRFTTYQALLDAIHQASTECIYIKDVSAEQFALIQRERGDKTPFRVKNFCPVQRHLIITVPSALHERSVTKIYAYIVLEIGAQGLTESWAGYQSTTFTNQYSGSAGEGDAAGGPADAEVGDLQDWPTLVIEAGYSQSLNHLRDRMAWWFRASGHQVKIILLIKLNPRSPGEIRIEKWQEIPLQDRAGATTTRASGTLRPNLMQVINIRRIDETAPNVPQSYAVTRGALRLDFAHLFLRQPEQGEGDIIIGIQQLQCVGAALGRIRG